MKRALTNSSLFYLYLILLFGCSQGASSSEPTPRQKEPNTAIPSARQRFEQLASKAGPATKKWTKTHIPGLKSELMKLFVFPQSKLVSKGTDTSHGLMRRGTHFFSYESPLEICEFLEERGAMRDSIVACEGLHRIYFYYSDDAQVRWEVNGCTTDPKGKPWTIITLSYESPSPN